MLKIIQHHVLHDKSPLSHKTRKNTTENWIRIAHAHKLSIFKTILQYCGIKVICFKLFCIFEYTFYFSKNSKIRCCSRRLFEKSREKFFYFMAANEVSSHKCKIFSREIFDNHRSGSIYFIFRDEYLSDVLISIALF